MKRVVLKVNSSIHKTPSSSSLVQGPGNTPICHHPHPFFPHIFMLWPCMWCPLQVLELPNKAEKVLSFAWEPKGHRFAIVHGDSGRPNVSFYSMRDDKGKLGIKHLGESTGCRAFVPLVLLLAGACLLPGGLRSGY